MWQLVEFNKPWNIHLEMGFKEAAQHFGKYAYLLSFWKWDEKIYISLMSVEQLEARSICEFWENG